MRNFTFYDSIQNQTRKKRWLDCLSFMMVFFIGQFLYAQEYQHLQIATGLNQDVIANGVGAANASTTSGVDVVNFAFVAADFQATVSSPVLTFGLPVNGLITSAAAATPNLTFQLAPYGVSNSLKLEVLNSSSILTFSNDVEAKKLIFLVTSGSGISTFTGVITFDDNTTQTISSSTVPDWFNSTTLPVAISGIGRVNTTNNTTENPAGNPRMYQLEVPILVANQTKTIESIQITKTSAAGNALNIFAITAELLGACPSPDALTTTVSTTSATVSWNIPAIVPTAGYQYYYSDTNTPPTGSTVPSGTLLGTATSVTLTPLLPTQNYFFWIRSDCGNSEYGTWQLVSFTTATPGHIGGNSTASNTNFPINTCFGFNYSQQIYLASELQAVLEPGSNYITEIRFKSNTLPTTPANFTSWTVYMGNTTQNVFANSTSWIPNLTPVFTGDLTFIANGWVSIVLNTGFVWDGTSNLVIGVDENTPNFSCTANWAAFPSGSNRGILYYSDSTNPDPASPPTANVAPNANIAQIQIQSTVLPNCLPPTSVVISNVTFQSADLDWTPLGTETEWQYVLGTSTATSPDALTPITVTGLPEASITTGLDPITTYKVWIRANCGSEYSPWTGPYTFKTLCSTFANYSSNFEGLATGTTSPMPDCWSKGGNGSTYLVTGSVAPMSPVNRLYMFASGTAAPPTEVVAILPSFSNLQANTHRLKFKAYATAVDRTLDVGYLTIPNDVTSFVFLQQVALPSTAATTATEFIIIPGALPAGVEKLAIRNSGIPTGSTTAYIDDVVWEAIPTCAEPSLLTATGITNSTATLGWTEANTATAWEIQYGAPGFTIGTGTIVAAPTNPFELTGLTANTNYVYYVRAVCSTTDSSYWTGPFAFKTQCDDVTEFSENFDALTSNFSTTMPDCWSRGIIGTPSLYVTTGSTLPMSPNNRLYMFVSSTTTPPSQAYAILPAVSNLSAGTHRLKFKAFATLADRFVEVGYLTDPSDLSTYTSLGDFQLPSTTVATTQQFTLVPTNVPAGVKHLVILNPGYPGASSTVYIDDVIWEAIPSCVEPTGVSVTGVLATTATLNWTAASPAPAEGYEYYISTTATNPDGTTVATGSVGAGITTAALTTLTPTTVYYVWVRSVCSTSDKSAWTTIATFTTPCASFTPAYTENFATWAPFPVSSPACWERYATGDQLTGPTGAVNSGSWVNDGYLNVGTTGAARINIFTTTVRGWLVSPVFDLTTGGYQVKYKVGATQYAVAGPITSGPAPTLGTDDFVYVLMSTDGGTTWTNLTTYNAANTPSHLGTTATFNIPTVTSNAVKFAFYGTSGTATEGQDLDFFIDDFEIQTIPVLPPDCATNVVATIDAACGNNATVISWDAAAGADGYKLTIGTTAGGSEILNNQVVGGLTYAFVGTLNTTYYYKVVPFNVNGDATGCTEQSFTTAVAGCYCVSLPTSNDGAGITSVIVGTTNFTNPDVTYTDNTATPVSLQQNVSSPIVLNFATGYTYNTYIWIDFNDNYIFDASELLYTGESAQPNPSTLNAAITIPVTASLGAHRMRIVTADVLTTPDSCYSGSYGVTLDFTINVIEEDLSTGGFDTDNFKYYPNPVTDILTVSYSNSISEVVVYNLLGQQVLTAKPNATQTQLDVSILTAGTYMVKVTSDEVTKTVKVVKN